MTTDNTSMYKKKISVQMITISLIVLVGMTIYETLKQLVWPDISIWGSHIITIFFSSICAALAAFFILQKQMKLTDALIIKNIESERLKKELKKKVEQLEVSITEIKTLTGLLPICSSCKKIRDDEGYWNQIESYIQKHSNAVFSHSFCPDCAKKLYPEVDHED